MSDLGEDHLDPGPRAEYAPFGYWSIPFRRETIRRLWRGLSGPYELLRPYSAVAAGRSPTGKPEAGSPFTGGRRTTACASSSSAPCLAREFALEWA